MTRARFLWTFVLATLLCVGAAHAEDDAIPEEARIYFQNGVELLQADPPNYQDAYYQFYSAYRVSKSWKVLGNLGLCALKLERDGEALFYYRQYLDHGADTIDPDERQAIERELLLVKGSMATVRLSADVPNVNIADTRVGGAAPKQAYTIDNGTLELGLRAGTHTITARTQDKTLSWEVVLTPGKEFDHEFRFNAPAAAPEPEATEAPAKATAKPEPVVEDQGTSASGSNLALYGYIAAGVGGAALIGGAVTGILAKKKGDDAYSDAQDVCTNDGICPKSAESGFNSADNLALMTNVLFIGGGVLAATGVTLILLDGGSSDTAAAKTQAKRQARLELSPLLTSGGGGIAATGAF